MAARGRRSPSPSRSSRRASSMPSLSVKQIQCGALPKPLELRGAEGMREEERVGGAIGMRDAALHRLAGRQIRKPHEADAVVFAYPVIIGCITERQCQQSLLLEVRLVDAGEGSGDDRGTAEQARRERGVLAARSFAVVVIA